MKTALIVGGTSGLGLELARQLKPTYDVIVTGQGKHMPDDFDVRVCDLSGGPELAPNIEALVKSLPQISLLIYAAGFVQLGTITDLQDGDIGKMACVGLIAPALFVRDLLTKQGRIEMFTAITSTSAFTPRLSEPMYTGVKAGLGMLAHSLSLDERIGQTLVAAPGGMATAFWDGTDASTDGFLDAQSVAAGIIKHIDGIYQYRFIKLPREAGLPELVEETPRT